MTGSAVLHVIAVAAVMLSASFDADAGDWSGPFTVAPASAPEMLLEAVGGGTAEGTIVSIGSPTGRTNQRWVLEAKADGLYAIHAAYKPDLVLAAKAGGKDNGTPIVLEADAGQPWQRWTIRRHRFNGSVGLVPQHAPTKGLDDFAGGKKAGDRQDLWDYIPTDEHLQWTLKPLPGATYPNDLPRAGAIKQLTFAASRIFPGTVRGITVFIPAEYDGSKPACVYVRQDGYNADEQGMLEALIASGDMPVTVGVFVTPGDLPAPMPDAMGRRNRGLEYDGMGDLFARFLAEEVLPYVAKQLDLKLSDQGKDRCIAGGSSGGIAAFNAAWERPDAFTRVYANSGSFVAFRGGHEFPTLVRKTEAKPIRAYLTTGMHDMENAAGDWYLLDQEMDKALRFSGYAYEFHAIDGPHVAGWNEHFPAAMKFIWKGWPEPVHAGPSAPRRAGHHPTGAGLGAGRGHVRGCPVRGQQLAGRGLLPGRGGQSDRADRSGREDCGVRGGCWERRRACRGAEGRGLHGVRGDGHGDALRARWARDGRGGGREGARRGGDARWCALRDGAGGEAG